MTGRSQARSGIHSSGFPLASPVPLFDSSMPDPGFSAAGFVRGRVLPGYMLPISFD